MTTDLEKAYELNRMKFLEEKLPLVRRRLGELAEEADRLKLPLVARHLDHYGKDLEERIAAQRQALKEPMKGWTQG